MVAKKKSVAFFSKLFPEKTINKKVDNRVGAENDVADVVVVKIRSPTLVLEACVEENLGEWLLGSQLGVCRMFSGGFGGFWGIWGVWKVLGDFWGFGGFGGFWGVLGGWLLGSHMGVCRMFFWGCGGFEGFFGNSF